MDYFYIGLIMIWMCTVEIRLWLFMYVVYKMLKNGALSLQ